MRAQQLTITFPKNKVQYKHELMRMKIEEQTNISAYVLDCIEKELGYVEKIKTTADQNLWWYMMPNIQTKRRGND